jgi:glycerol-3-phosphate acyltransferase PlsX
MGGEFGVPVTVPATVRALKLHKDLHVSLIGDQAQIDRALAECRIEKLRSRLDVVHTPHQVTDTDKPTAAIRARDRSSLFIAIQLVKTAKADACVSSGNTGALLLTGRHLLKTLPGIDRPAIVATIPGSSRGAYLLDVGANVDCQAEQLFQFAVMGSVLAESLNGQPRARVGLLNIGVEDFKGNEQVRRAATLLENCPAINYVGYVEGNALFDGAADVVVCDGFVGNVTIKSSAGVVNVINSIMRQRMNSNLLNRMASLLTLPLLHQLQERIDPARYNGASLLGLQGSIIKSHGNAREDGFLYAITRAVREAELGVPALIAEKVAGIMTASHLAARQS